MKTLEENVEQSLLREERALSVGDGAKSDTMDSPDTQRQLMELRNKYDVR